MTRRILAATLGAFDGLNGLAMLFDPQGWFVRVPGVVDTGPFNRHFVQDVGLAFIASAVALVAFAWRPRWQPAALAGANFLVLHALLHLWMIAHGHSTAVASDLALVVLPAALALAVAWPTRITSAGRGP